MSSTTAPATTSVAPSTTSVAAATTSVAAATTSVASATTSVASATTSVAPATTAPLLLVGLPSSGFYSTFLNAISIPFSPFQSISPPTTVNMPSVYSKYGPYLQSYDNISIPSTSSSTTAAPASTTTTSTSTTTPASTTTTTSTPKTTPATTTTSTPTTKPNQTLSYYINPKLNLYSFQNASLDNSTAPQINWSGSYPGGYSVNQDINNVVYTLFGSYSVHENIWPTIIYTILSLLLLIGIGIGIYYLVIYINNSSTLPAIPKLPPTV